MVRQVNYRFYASHKWVRYDWAWSQQLIRGKYILRIVHERLIKGKLHTVIVFADRHSSTKSADQNRCIVYSVQYTPLSFQFKSLMLAGTQNQVTKIL